MSAGFALLALLAWRRLCARGLWQRARTSIDRFTRRTQMPRFAWRRIRAMAGLCLALLVAAAPELAWACTCVGSDVATRFRGARTVVIGRVLDSRAQSETQSGIAVTRIAVDDMVRGGVGAELIVRHVVDGNVCGVRFEPGERVAIFAGPLRDGEVWVGACEMPASGQQQAVAALVQSYRERLAQADRRVAQNPADIGARLARAALLGDWGDTDPALAAYSEIVERWPRDPRGWLAQGALLLQQERAAEAVAPLARAAALDPGNAQAQRLLRQARRRAGGSPG
jgi:hypothetical protein